MAHFLFSKALSEKIEQVAVLRRLGWALEAGVIGLFWWICARLSPDAASGLGRRLIGWLGPRSRKSVYMLRNLRIAFPELSEEARQELVREIWGHTGAVLAEYPHLKHMVQVAFDEHFTFETEVDLTPYREGRKRGIFVTAHFGNWEASAGVARQMGMPMTVVYTPIKNPMIDRMLKRKREALGCKLLDRNSSLPQLMRALDAGESLGLVVDHRDDSGVPLPFFGLDKLTTVVPARLALRFGCDLLPVRIERRGGAHFHVILYPPVAPDPSLASPREQAEQMTREIHGHFEDWIRARPQQWMCSKRAWPKGSTPPVQAAES